jgi:hypothetical protein
MHTLYQRPSRCLMEGKAEVQDQPLQMLLLLSPYRMVGAYQRSFSTSIGVQLRCYCCCVCERLCGVNCVCAFVPLIAVEYL